MYETLILLFALLVSFYLFGLIRTAMWLGIGLLLRENSALISSTVLSASMVFFLMAPFQSGAFDFRDFSKQKMVLGIFLSSIATGLLFLPFGVIIYPLAAVTLLALVFIFKIFRFPLVRVYFLPQHIPWIIAGFWGFLMLKRILIWTSL